MEPHCCGRYEPPIAVCGSGTPFYRAPMALVRGPHGRLPVNRSTRAGQAAFRKHSGLSRYVPRPILCSELGCKIMETSWHAPSNTSSVQCQPSTTKTVYELLSPSIWACQEMVRMASYTKTETSPNYARSLGRAGVIVHASGRSTFLNSLSLNRRILKPHGVVERYICNQDVDARLSSGARWSSDNTSSPLETGLRGSFSATSPKVGTHVIPDSTDNEKS